jgi:hypothetical protein
VNHSAAGEFLHALNITLYVANIAA